MKWLRILAVAIACASFAVAQEEMAPEPIAEPPAVEATSAVEEPPAAEDSAVVEDPPMVEAPLRVQRGQRLGLGTDVEIPAGVLHRGEAVAIFANATIAGKATGDVVVVGGRLELTGEVRGQVVAVMSDVVLGPDARIGGGLVNVLGSLDDGGAELQGDHVNIPFDVHMPGIRSPLRILLTLLLWTKILMLVLVFIGILVLTTLVPERVRRLSVEASTRPFLPFFLGLLFWVIGFPLLITLLAMSVIGLLAVPVLVVVLAVLTWLGLAGIFHMVGAGIGRMFGREMSVLGAVVLGFILFGLVKFVPIVGFVVWMLLTWWGFGLLLTCRAGSPDAPVVPRGGSPYRGDPAADVAVPVAAGHPPTPAATDAETPPPEHDRE